MNESIQKKINIHVLKNSSNVYISKQIIDYILNKKNMKDIIIVCWTDAYKEEGYNDILGHVSFDDEQVTIYEDQKYYNKQDKQFSLNFLKHNLYNCLHDVCIEYMNLFRKDILYNMTIKYMYMISTEILLQENKIQHYFFDLEDSEINPSMEDLLTIMYERKEEDEFEGILRQYQYLKNHNKNWLTYKGFDNFVNNLLLS